jgi:hypothetical protein
LTRRSIRRSSNQRPLDTDATAHKSEEKHHALDVYYHPYAYADLEDVYEKENRRAA